MVDSQILTKTDRKHLEAFKVWIWRKALIIRWKDEVTKCVFTGKSREGKIRVEHYWQR